MKATDWVKSKKIILQLDKRTNELAIVVKDIRALRDSFEP